MSDLSRRDESESLLTTVFVVFVLVLVSVCYFSPMLTGATVFVERDLAPYFLPPRILWVNLVKSFVVPLWNPYNYSGIPLLATLQPGILYPPNMLFLLLPFPLAWNWLIILHFPFVGFTTYCLLRYLKASSLASFAGGLVFMLSGYLLSVHNLLPHLLGVGWFPLVLLYFLKYLKEGRYRCLVLSAGFLTVQFLAGVPEIVVLTILVLIIVALCPRCFLTSCSLGWFKRIGSVVLFVICFSLISAVQLLPFYELKLLSIRGSGLSYLEATTWSFSWRDFILFFLPDAYGYGKTEASYWTNQSWLKTVYIGAMPFIMSLFFFCFKDRRRFIFGVLMVVSVVLALGGHTPLYDILHRIPPFNAIRYPVKFLFLFFFIIAMSCALGADKLNTLVSENNEKAKRIILISFYGGFVLAGLWGYANLFESDVRSLLDLHNFKPDRYNDIAFNLHNLKRFLLFSFLFCLLLFLYLRVRYKKCIMYCVVLLLAADLFLANYAYYNRVSWSLFTVEHRFASHLKEQESMRYFVTTKTNETLGQYFPLDRAMLNSPYAAIFGLYTIGGCEVMRLAYYDLFMSMLLGSATLEDAKRYIDIAGIRYMIASYEVVDRDFRLVETVDTTKGKVYLHKYLGGAKRYALYGRVRHVNNDGEMVAALLDRNIDLNEELIVLSKERLTGPTERDAKGEVVLLSYGPNRIELESACESDAFLYLNDTYYPGWRAYVDGKETKIYRANLAFRAIEVPKGRHTVVFRYVPVSFYMGLVLTLLGIALCIWLWRRDDGGKAAAPGDGQGNETPGDAVSGT